MIPENPIGICVFNVVNVTAERKKRVDNSRDNYTVFSFAGEGVKQGKKNLLTKLFILNGMSCFFFLSIGGMILFKLIC